MGISEAAARRSKKKYNIESKKEGAQWNWRVVAKTGNMLNKTDEHLDPGTASQDPDEEVMEFEQEEAWTL